MCASRECKRNWKEERENFSLAFKTLFPPQLRRSISHHILWDAWDFFLFFIALTYHLYHQTPVANCLLCLSHSFERRWTFVGAQVLIIVHHRRRIARDYEATWWAQLPARHTENKSATSQRIPCNSSILYNMNFYFLRDEKKWKKMGHIQSFCFFLVCLTFNREKREDVL
jgi:hypothetical protein